MPDPVMVICVDGPTRGRLRAVTGGERTRFHAYDIAVRPVSWPVGEDIALPVLTYHVHIIQFLDFWIRIASMQINQNNIDPYDIINALFNESARQATYRTRNV